MIKAQELVQLEWLGSKEKYHVLRRSLAHYISRTESQRVENMLARELLAEFYLGNNDQNKENLNDYN